MFQTILATTIDDLPRLRIEVFHDTTRLFDHIEACVEMHNDESDRLVTFTATADVGAAITLHDIDDGEPVVVIIRIA